MTLLKGSRETLVPACAHEQPGVAVRRGQHEPSQRARRLLMPLLGDGRTCRVDPLNLRIPAGAPFPGADEQREQHRDGPEGQQHTARLEAWPECLRAALVVPRAQRDVLFAGDEAGVVLVDVELALEPQRVGVVPQEALDIGGRRQHVELLLLERLQVLAADFRLLLELEKIELLAQACLAETVADLEHGLGRL